MVTESFRGRTAIPSCVCCGVSSIPFDSSKPIPSAPPNCSAKYTASTTQRVLTRRYQTLLGVYPDYPVVSVSAIQSIIDVLKEDGKIKDAPPAATFIDMSYLRAVENERQK